MLLPRWKLGSNFFFKYGGKNQLNFPILYSEIYLKRSSDHIVFILKGGMFVNWFWSGVSLCPQSLHSTISQLHTIKTNQVTVNILTALDRRTSFIPYFLFRNCNRPWTSTCQGRLCLFWTFYNHFFPSYEADIHLKRNN